MMFIPHTQQVIWKPLVESKQNPIPVGRTKVRVYGQSLELSYKSRKVCVSYWNDLVGSSPFYPVLVLLLDTRIFKKLNCIHSRM